MSSKKVRFLEERKSSSTITFTVLNTAFSRWKGKSLVFNLGSEFHHENDDARHAISLSKQ
jgi:hypothetical protein